MNTPKTPLHFHIRGGCWIARDPWWVRPALDTPQKADVNINSLGFRTLLPARKPRV